MLKSTITKNCVGVVIPIFAQDGKKQLIMKFLK